MRSLAWKLAGALLLVAVISVGLTAFLVSQSTSNEFRQYLSNCDMAYVQSIEKELVHGYNKDNSWANARLMLNSQLQSANDRLVLADENGIVVGDTADDWLGKSIKDIGLINPMPITISGKVKGNLFLMYFGSLADKGSRMMNRACMVSDNTIALSQTEQDFLNRVNNYLWLVGFMAFAVAVFLGILLTRQILLPVRALKKGAREVASGKLNYQVKTNSKDELGELAQTFNSMASSLSKIEQSRQRLTADIAHELRTPLTVIEGTVDAMLDGVYKPDKEHLVSIKEQTAQLTRLINDLREISLAESGQLKLDLAPTNIVDLVRRKLTQFELKALEKEIQLKLNFSGNIPEIKVDVVRIEQVIANLLTNAIRHTPKSGLITVSLETATAETSKNLDKPSLIISIADNGEGIPAEHLEHIFDRFYRVESSRTKNNGETGLGLAIVKQMIEAHDGKVWAVSTPGKGSTFFVALPLD